MKHTIFNVLLLFFPLVIFAQNAADWEKSPGIIGTLVLILIVAFVAVIIMSAKISAYVESLKKKQTSKKGSNWKEEIVHLKEDEIDDLLEQRKAALSYQLSGKELSHGEQAKDSRGLVNQANVAANETMFADKMSHEKMIKISPALKKVVIYYLAAATFWLVFGTLVGEYLGLKFVFPEIDKTSWLSFGRLRPVHTNTVFWGWSSLAMLGLGNYVIAKTSNRELFSPQLARTAWYLINASLVLGNLCLMAGINNGGGEYREYIWPVFLLFLSGLIVTFYNFYKTVALRKIKEIYISNWYILAALIWTTILVIIGYLPFYQDALGETIVQGYYMHQGVGMWFMTFSLGLIYYYLPSAVNKPIYSYALGVLAFWTQMLFYSLIGTHHFIFSPLPWWLQTVAIVFSMGMFIPVIAGTTNFLMTMRGSWSQISKSYVLPFFLVGIIYYFVGSSQGSFQAFRFTNYVWHFTDFNVAHSHMTMYGIICFILWGAIYFIVPKITGNQARPVFVGAHFWLAFLGLFLYMTSLMVGGTLKGLSWIEGNPFIESVILMREYWVWRAIGGTMMFLSHLIFAYNLYVMVKTKNEPSFQTIKN
ncbi:MAG TPA: cbb3-type cytochrome c oxidase subunit I [Moheibacter sp.]|nr:cbb3-type cytochrome c oxidase subunit I [Moheibacter sp.]